MRPITLAGPMLLALLVGCSQDRPGDPPCTMVPMIGSLHGLGVTVAPDLAPVRGLVLEVCADGCREHRVRLIPGTSTGTETCTGDGPDDSCSVEVTPDGGQHGYIVAELPVGPVKVSGRYVVAGRDIDLPTASVEAETSYPHGPDCGADGTQAQVTIDNSGLR